MMINISITLPNSDHAVVEVADLDMKRTSLSDSWAYIRGNINKYVEGGGGGDVKAEERISGSISGASSSVRQLSDKDVIKGIRGVMKGEGGLQHLGFLGVRGLKDADVEELRSQGTVRLHVDGDDDWGELLPGECP